MNCNSKISVFLIKFAQGQTMNKAPMIQRGLKHSVHRECVESEPFSEAMIHALQNSFNDSSPTFLNWSLLANVLMQQS